MRDVKLSDNRVKELEGMSKKSIHSPGPWHTGGKDGRIIYDSDGKPVADATVYMPSGFDSMQSNAALIASAPELLEALRSIASAIGTVERNIEPCGLGSIRRVAIEAIKKAEGNTK